MNDGARSRERPKLEPQIAVVGDERAGASRRLDRGEDGVAGRSRDRLADPRDMQRLGAAEALEGDVARRQAGWPPSRRADRRTHGPLFAVSDEVDAGRGVRIGAHRARIDALACPESAKGAARLVLADRRHIADGGALAGGRDGGVRGVAAEAEEIAAIASRRVELGKRLADAEDVDEHRRIALLRPRRR